MNPHGRPALMAAVVFVFAGCGGQLAPTSAMPQSTMTQSRAHQASGSYGDLLYVANWDTEQVLVFSYPQAQLVASFEASAWGMCSDSEGAVWVLGFGGGSKYAHGGTTAIASVSYSDLEPVSCAADASSGDLAIFGADASGDGGPRVVVWPGGGGDPTTYLNGWTYFPEYGAYDGSGNLFFDADQNTSPSALLLKELPSAGKEIQNVSVDKGLPAQAGGMEWLGGHAFAMAAGGNLTYRLLISGSVATVRGTTRLRGLRYSSSTSIADGTIVETRNPKAVGIWSYPKGGRVVHEITGLGIAKYLGGLTVSVAPSDTRTRH